MANPQRIRVNPVPEEIQYDIIIGVDLLKSAGDLIKEVYEGEKIFLVSDKNVFNLYGQILKKSLTASGFQVISFILPQGENAKSYEYLQKGYDKLIKNSFHRDELIVALGGGVTGDLAGYLAATYMRGSHMFRFQQHYWLRLTVALVGKQQLITVPARI